MMAGAPEEDRAGLEHMRKAIPLSPKIAELGYQRPPLWDRPSNASARKSSHQELQVRQQPRRIRGDISWPVGRTGNVMPNGDDRAVDLLRRV